MLHAAVRIRCGHAHIFVTRRVASGRCSREVFVRANRMHRRHRRADAIRHQGQAEQGVQQEWAKAHCRSVLPAYPGRSRSVHLRANRGRADASSSAIARFPLLTRAGDTPFSPHPTNVARSAALPADRSRRPLPRGGSGPASDRHRQNSAPMVCTRFSWTGAASRSSFRAGPAKGPDVSASAIGRPAGLLRVPATTTLSSTE